MTARRLVPALAALAVVCAQALALAQQPTQQSAPPTQYGYPYGPYPQGPVLPVPPPPTPMRRNSTGMMVAGIVMTAVGGAALVSGVFVYMVDTRGMCVDAESAQGGSFESGCETQHSVPGIVMMVAGGASVAAGIPLTVIGAQQVPVDGPTAASIVPDLRISPTRAALAWTF